MTILSSSIYTHANRYLKVKLRIHSRLRWEHIVRKQCFGRKGSSIGWFGSGKSHVLGRFHFVSSNVLFSSVVNFLVRISCDRWNFETVWKRNFRENHHERRSKNNILISQLLKYGKNLEFLLLRFFSYFVPFWCLFFCLKFCSEWRILFKYWEIGNRVLV